MAVLYFATLSNGWCLKGGGKYIKIYKKLNLKGEAWKVSSNNVCNNLISDTTQFVSGKSGGAYSCKVYPNNNCKGTPVSLNSSGRNFGFSGRSMRCPC